MAGERGAFHARSSAPETTEALGERLGRALVPGALVALIGELGSGKTTLTRGLARGLDVREPVVSPTFTRMRVLPGRLTLFHFDAWRGGAEELYAEATDLLAGDGVAVVEWADRVSAALPLPRIEIELRHVFSGTARSGSVVSDTIRSDADAAREIRARVLAPAPRSGPAAEELAAALAAALEAARTTGGLALLAAP